MMGFIMKSHLAGLRNTEVRDLDFVIEAETNEENSKFIGQWTYSQHEAALADRDISHIIVEDSEGERIGYIILIGLNDPNQALCIKRIAIARKGQGYGKEALSLIMKWVFENTETHRLWLKVMGFNHRARHVYESVGFIYEGTLRECLKVGGVFQSLSILSILKTEYKR